MDIGISTASYFPTLVTEACFAEIRKAGASVCEVFLESYHEYSEDFTPTLLKNQCIDVHSIHAISSQFEAEIISHSERAMNDSIYWFRKVCAQGQAMGARCYTYHGPMVLKKRPVVYDFDRIAPRFQILADVANEYGITLCYENVHYAFFREPQYFAELKKRVPNLGTCFDNKQAMQSGYGWKEYFAVQKDRLGTVHLCDYDSDGNLLLPGRGTFDFGEFFNVMYGEGVEAPCMLEVYAGSYKDFSEIKEAYDYLCSVRDKFK